MCFWETFTKILCDLCKIVPGFSVLDLSSLTETLNMCRLSSLLQYEIIFILFWKVVSLSSGSVPFANQKIVFNYQCAAFVHVIYFKQSVCFQTYTVNLTTIISVWIPKESLGLIFAVSTQIMRMQTWQCVQSNNKWTTKDAPASIHAYKMANLAGIWVLFYSILQLRMHIVILNPRCYWSLKAVRFGQGF